ncbi:MAG: DUF928 domain-containing protein [Microcoleus sp. PH2017_01_SCD_O_A]|uniref:DUF928 domain-containing protein n=1 Tax=unclassified Microcoleus TaxID=2642155 RepID=UPI001D7D444D|nr:MULTISPECIES: DUF928 domain-containing protein [unclassified Microcoleus]MCC3419879.1 DUF928 domain-containing protein [Microcoleus sp. PH2017_07_MST_O_A]MCC3509681.1 DUF928 domain-containing protein [Microcoleus sp. PH2017_17_BER_D_A]TAE08706.1 MAG: DUF928 domain-containing protein [Oscillatoriales cyanobacterium]MCC3425021.1 DUF928 domain-containing protein [Microcoleus sp. PH2017_01_SCD_O_A]MCC3450359.1 DUF928 domain-containing protein [Microcoleus sp. PH2017_09_SFU_O_A]
MKRFLNGVALAIAAFAIALTLPSLVPPMQAVPAPILLSQNINFRPPDLITPDNRRGTPAFLSPCPVDLSIIPLMPPTNIGLTLTESPTFFAYVSLNSTQVEFILQTDDEKLTEVYKTTFKVDKPGIVEVNIPKKTDRQTFIEVKKRYQWWFLVACDPDDRSSDYYVKGFVQRIAPQETLKNDLANPDPMARAIAYAKNGIWYDTISTLAQMRRQAPDDPMLKAEWTQLLNSQKLESIAYKPLVQSF